MRGRALLLALFGSVATGCIDFGGCDCPPQPVPREVAAGRWRGLVPEVDAGALAADGAVVGPFATGSSSEDLDVDYATSTVTVRRWVGSSVVVERWRIVPP